VLFRKKRARGKGFYAGAARANLMEQLLQERLDAAVLLQV
jgi:hypothetical protein